MQSYFEPEIVVKTLNANFYLPPHTASLVIVESVEDPSHIKTAIRAKQETKSQKDRDMFLVNVMLSQNEEPCAVADMNIHAS